jgi:hypothetical protein
MKGGRIKLGLRIWIRDLLPDMDQGITDQEFTDQCDALPLQTKTITGSNLMLSLKTLFFVLIFRLYEAQINLIIYRYFSFTKVHQEIQIFLCWGLQFLGSNLDPQSQYHYPVYQLAGFLRAGEIPIYPIQSLQDVEYCSL